MPAMVYFLRRGEERLTCETRLSPGGAGYEIEVLRGLDSHVERFHTIEQVLSREHELLAAWRALGWAEVGGYSPVHAAEA